MFPGDHHQGITSKKHLTRTNQQTLHTVETCKKAKQVKYRRFFVLQLYRPNKIDPGVQYLEDSLRT
jgi:hypothetical protein